MVLQGHGSRSVSLLSSINHCTWFVYLAPYGKIKFFPDQEKTCQILSYHIVWNGQLYCQKVNFISYHKTGVSYLHVLFHTCKCHFIPHRYYFIPTHVISYLQQPVSYAKILFHICVRILCACNVSYLNMSFHTFDNLFHSGVHLLYRASPYSAWAVL